MDLFRIHLQKFRMITLIVILILASTRFYTIIERSEAHSFLLEPRGDYRTMRKPECRFGGPPHAPNDTCVGPCIDRNSWQFYQGKRPEYRRGQLVTISWARNNHRGGFIRLSILPIADRMNYRAHEAMAFRYGCFAAEEVPCEHGDCGTDEDMLRYRTTVQIPTIFDDGVYVLAWVWYGGTVRKTSYFGTYWSCTEVLITGGPITFQYQPVFLPGGTINWRNMNNPNTCFAAASDVLTCPREPCTVLNGSFSQPKPFRNGHVPDPIQAYWRAVATNYSEPRLASSTISPSTSPSPSAKPLSSETFSLLILPPVESMD